MFLERVKVILRAFIPQNLKSSLYHKTKSRALYTLTGLSFKEFIVSFPQFFTWKYPITSFLRSFKYMFLAILRVVLGRSPKISYSFQGEDRNIEGILKPLITINGFYVDVGCNDPRFISNTFLFYKRGWRGICIDANEKLIRKFKRIRPRDKSICALVSNNTTEGEFIELTNDVLSTVNQEYIPAYLEEGQKVVNRKIMQFRTLTDILDQNNAPAKFDLLSIDVEGNDFLVIQSLDFEKYTPILIVLESDRRPEELMDDPVYIFLKDKGYELIGNILNNLYFKVVNKPPLDNI